ncbi:hypothetical protein CK203_080665 [Vitis vinifera]|uniref:Reverse transcriptase Ty1/copia-type domain-containing protein n=1 Tax=Vitis vinifera TaxID=29760 RepID=A0A438EZI3_VITVI|nr:hypothetical protein CK203_080665 [Vitis vinifera]
MKALEKNETWEMVDLPKGKTTVGANGCLQLNTSWMDCLKANLDWPLQLLAMKYVFLNGDLEEEVYMDAPLSFDGRFGSKDGKIVVLIVYLDDIILTRDDLPEMNWLKKSLSSKFEIKD